MVLEVDGSFDNPVYIQQLTDRGQAPRNQNVFPFSANLATSMVIEMIRLVIADTWWPDRAGRQTLQHDTKSTRSSKLTLQ